MLLRPLSTRSYKNLPKLIVFIGTLALLPQTVMAEDQRLEAALRGLDAAMKRIDALESKVGKMSSLEEENKQLKSRIVKLETRHQSIARKNVPQQLTALEYPAAPMSEGGLVNSAASEPSNKDNWQGIYVGLNAAYGANAMNQRDITNSSIFDQSIYFAGPLVGLQAGYNSMLNANLMLGVETDANWANVYNLLNNRNTAYTNLQYNCLDFFCNTIGAAVSFNSNYYRIGLDASGSTRFRLGYTFGNFMPYISGGVAYGMISNETRYSSASTPYPNSFFPYFSNGQAYTETENYKVKVSAGWAAGAGVEYKVADNWSTKFEYLYTSINGINFNAGSTIFGTFGLHQARVGLNYHTDWLKELPVSLR